VLKDDGTLWVNIGDSYNGQKKGNTETNKHKGVVTDTFEKKLWNGAKEKDMIGIPWMLAFALREDGWYLRQDIIWHKPNPMPESTKDRCTKSHEYIFLLSKHPQYYFDYEAIQEEASGSDTQVRNKRDVWSVCTKPNREAHFATFPEELIKPCILAGSRLGGVVLDPFFGSGTTGRVAREFGRQYIGIELNPEYVEIANRRAVEVQLSIFGMEDAYV
jgi:DNA modification methylase